MLLMLILEIPVNAAAIDLLRLPVAESCMLATFFALADLIATKYTARAVRQWDRDDAPARSIAVALIANAPLLAGLLALASMRADAAGGADSLWAFLALQLMFYTVALLASCFQIPPDAQAEQDARQPHRAERLLRRSWEERSRLAQRYNIALNKALSQIRRADHDCARRVAQRRAKRWPDAPDATPLAPITAANLQPLHLGESVDHNPLCIDAVVLPRRLP